MISKLDDCVAGVWFVFHEHDYTNWTTQSFYYQLIIKVTIPEKRLRIAKLWKKEKTVLVIESKVVIDDLNFECDWLIELSAYKLTAIKLVNNNLAYELVENGSFF